MKKIVLLASILAIVGAVFAQDASVRLTVPTVAPKTILTKDVLSKRGIDLPGVVKVAPADNSGIDFTKPQIIATEKGRSYPVYLNSNGEWNLIELPFANPKPVTLKEIEINKAALSRNVFVRFLTQQPVHLYLESEEGDTVSLQLIPKDIPSQTVVVRMSMSRVDQKKESNNYITNIQDVMQSAALGKRPARFSDSTLDYPPIVYNGLNILTERVYASQAQQIFVYRVSNPHPQAITLSEREFDGENVVAVSIFPKPILASGEEVKVLVLTKTGRD